MKAKTSFYVTMFALAAVLAFAAGCSKAPNDAQITSDVQSKISADSGLQGKQIGVQTNAGSVTLSGTVENEAQRDAAARYAAGSPGVKQVVNNIEVASTQAQADAQPQPAPEPPQQTAASSQASPTRHHRARHHEASNNDDSASSGGDSQEAPAMAQAQESTPPPPATQPVADAVPATPPPPPPPLQLTIPSGTVLSVRLVDPLNSETAQQGATFRATLNSPLSVDGQTAIPAGYEVEGHVAEVQSAGKFKGKSLLTLQLDRLIVGKKSYSIQTDQFHREGSSRGKNTAEKVGGGAVVGAIIGGIFGGGKGAAIGSAAGAGAGGGVQAVTKGQQIDLPSETQLSFTLQAPVTVTQTKRSPHQSSPSLQNDSNN